MRKQNIKCVKCNTQNATTSLTCSNCGFRINDNNVALPVSENQNQPLVEDNKNIAENISVQSLFNQSIKDTDLFRNNKTCISCGYLLSGLSEKCPECGNDISEIIDKPLENELDIHNETKAYLTVKQDSPEKIRTNTNRSDIANKEINEHTISIFTPKIEAPIAILEPLELNQKSPKQNKDIPLSESRTDINRGDIDEQDNTISAVEHASIEFKEGQWLINNKASNKALFIQVKNQSVLQDGDILLFGTHNFYVFRVLNENKEK